MIPFVGGSYTLDVRKADVQRTVNLFPVASENAGSAAPTYLQSIPGLDVFSDVSPPSASLWLDTFTGDAGTQLTAHAQDVPLNGSVWLARSAFSNVLPQLTGAGQGTAVADEDGLTSAAVTQFDADGAQALVFPLTLVIELTPVPTQPNFEFAGFNSLIDLRMDGSEDYSLTVDFFPAVVDGGSPAQLTVRAFPGGDSGVYNVISGQNTASVLMEADGFTATVNGAAQAKVATTMLPFVNRLFLNLGASQEGGERLAPFASVSRLELIGTKA